MPDRIIRESICTSDTLNELTDFEERFWHRLIVNCDDFGRYDARPEILKGRLFPLMSGRTNKDMTDALHKLASVGLVELYEVDGKPFLHVATWEKYQRIRAKKSKFPTPVNACCQMPSNVPVIQANAKSEMRNAECGDESDVRTQAQSAIAVVMSAYLDKINPTPSQYSLDELKGYVEQMGAECCLRAFDIALDAKKANWQYIRGILRSKLRQGVRCIADWDALEAKREAKIAPQVEKTDEQRVEENRKYSDEMQRVLAMMKDG